MKTVMGEYETLERILSDSLYSGKNRLYSFVQTSGFKDWKTFLLKIIKQKQDGTIYIRTTEPYSVIGEEAHYISFILFRNRSTMILYNSEPNHSETLQRFIERTQRFVSRYGWSFSDCSPISNAESFQIHKNDTFCQSWSAFILQHVSNWEPRRNYYYNKLTKEKTTNLKDLFPKPKLYDTKIQRLSIILWYIKFWVVETEESFNFSVKHQLETQYGEKLEDTSFGKEITRSVHEYMTV
tara:strand:- start:16 stop:732 length:717 start_codon:yes stop_codon:yes gene_type:complete